MAARLVIMGTRMREPSNRELAEKLNEVIRALTELNEQVQHAMDRIRLVECSAQRQDTPGDDRSGDR